MFATQHNPLLARSRRNRGLAVSLFAGLAALAAGTFAVSAKTTPAPQSQQGSQQQNVQIASSELRGAETSVQPERRRQVRVIPLFNTPADQTGK